MVYESFSTERDIVLFAKGMINRQWLNLEAKYVGCIFNNTINYYVLQSLHKKSLDASISMN